MKSSMRIALFFTLPAVLCASFITSRTHAQTTIFDDSTLFNGDFGGDESLHPNNGGFGFVDIDPSDTPSQNVTRRAGNNITDAFAGNWLLNSSSGFGGIDQVRSNLNPGLLANDGATITGIAYATPGNLGADDEIGGTGADADVLPSGAFSATLNSNFRVDFTFNAVDNTVGGTFDWTIGLLLDGETDLNNLVVLGTGTVTGPAGSDTNGNPTEVAVSGSGILPASATSYNVVAQLDNSNGGNDQVWLDDLSLIYRNDLGVQNVGDVLIGGVRNGIVDINDFNAIRDNFFNGTSGGSEINGEAIGAVNGVVDLGDFLAWKGAFSSSATSSLSAVPEPGTAILTLLASAIGACGFSRRK